MRRVRQGMCRWFRRLARTYLNRKVIMHEVHLVEAIIESVEKKAKAKAVRKVNSVKIRFNALTSHSADHVRFSFELAKRDKPLFKETRLDLNEVEPLLRCLPCNRTFLGA